METVRQLEGRWLARGILVAAIAAFSAVAGAQTGGQVAPPPADLEPGVNTSATQPERSGGNPEKRQGRDAGQTSSPEPAATPAPQQTPVQTTAKPATAAGRTTGASGTRQGAGATSVSPGAGATNAARGAGATSAPPAASSAPLASPSALTGSSGNSSAAAAPSTAGAAGTPSTVPKSGATAASTAPAGKAHDSLQLDTTQITGNRELPKVLYIVPWKRSDLGDLVGKPVNSLLDEVLTPVDRDVFKRQNRYYDALKPDAAKDGAGTAAGADVKH